MEPQQKADACCLIKGRAFVRSNGWVTCVFSSEGAWFLNEGLNILLSVASVRDPGTTPQEPTATCCWTWKYSYQVRRVPFKVVTNPCDLGSKTTPVDSYFELSGFMPFFSFLRTVFFPSAFPSYHSEGLLSAFAPFLRMCMLACGRMCLPVSLLWKMEMCDTIWSCSQLKLFSNHNCAVISLLPWEYYC